MNVLRDTVCSRQVIDYTLDLVLIMALIVIVNFVREHYKHSIGVSWYPWKREFFLSDI